MQGHVQGMAHKGCHMHGDSVTATMAGCVCKLEDDSEQKVLGSKRIDKYDTSAQPY
jgi:hypothetical protein